MANKKKKYNAKFPPARVKKIMQKDEEVGKVAAAVPVIIARALEFFVMDLMSKANERIMSKNAKTLTPEHIKQTVNLVEEFSFLKELVAPISDVQSNNNHTQAPKQTSKQKHEAKQEMKQLRNESSSSASSFLLQTDETPVFKVPTRGRPKKLKVPPEEVSSKSKKMKVTNYVSLPEDCVEEKKEEDVQHAFQVVMNNFNPAVEPSTALQNIPLSQPPSLPLTSPPIPSFTSPLAASSISNRILFQPPLESSLNSKLTTSNKIADALQAINSNNSAPTNNTNNNNGAFINISNILNYNHSNTLLAEAYNNTSNFSNNQEYSLNNTNHNNTNTFTPATVIDSSDSQHIPHPPTNISQLGDNFSHLDEVLDLSKQATNQEAAEQLKKTLTDGNHLGLNPNNNLFISNTLLNNNNPLVANNNCFNNNTASNNDINAIINSKADKRPSEMYKLNVPKLNSFYHRSTSSS